MNEQQTRQLTALGPDAIDDGDAGRQQRGMAIAALTPVVKNKLGYKVPSQSGSGSYVVNLDGEPFCTCPDFERGIFKKCVNSQAVYPLSEQHGLEAQERR